MSRSRQIALIAFCCAIISIASPVRGAIENRDVLKTYFETGDVPTEDQFANLIDSYVQLELGFGNDLDDHNVQFNPLATGGTVGGIAGGGAGTGGALYLEAGESVGPQLDYSPDPLSVGRASNWPAVSGFLGLQFQLDGPTGPTTHYGFVQLRVDGPTSATPYAVHVDAFAYETTPDAAIATFQLVPEPATGGLMLSAVSVLLLRRRR